MYPGIAEDKPIDFNKLIEFPKLSPQSFQHQWDMQAIEAMAKIPLFPNIVQKISSIFSEKLFRLTFTANAVRLGPNQGRSLYKKFEKAAAVLDIPKMPEIYLSSELAFNAIGAGIDQYYLVLFAPLVDALNEEELLAAIGHELGHLKCNHEQYMTIAYLLKTFGDAIFSFLARGARFHSRGKYKQAVEDFTRAIRIEPDGAAGYFARGRSYHYLDEDARAVADFDQAVRLAPDEVYNYVARGESLYAMGNYQAAISDFGLSLRLNPRAAHYYNYCIGLCLSRQGDYASAVAAFSRAIEHNPDQVHYYIERGRNYRWRGAREMGEMDYERATRLDMDRADRYFDNTTKDYISLD